MSTTIRKPPTREVRVPEGTAVHLVGSKLTVSRGETFSSASASQWGYLEITQEGSAVTIHDHSAMDLAWDCQCEISRLVTELGASA